MNKSTNIIGKLFRGLGVISAIVSKKIVGKEFIGIQELRSASDNGAYVKVVNSFLKNPKKFRNFKRNSVYRSILEHTTKVQAERYYEIITRDTPEFIQQVEKFLVNDEVGNPNLMDIDGIGRISPSTLRYVKIASDLKHLYGSLDGMSIAEIGVGYGGQALILGQEFEIASIDFFDLRPVLKLAAQYLDSFLMTPILRFLTINEASYDRSYDLVISNYAFSELPKPLQMQYIRKVISNSKHGYMIMNSGRGGGFDKGKMSFDELLSFIPSAKIMDEDPLTYEYNYILYW